MRHHNQTEQLCGTIISKEIEAPDIDDILIWTSWTLIPPFGADSTAEEYWGELSITCAISWTIDVIDSLGDWVIYVNERLFINTE